MKKIQNILIIAGFLILFLLAFYILDFKELSKTTRLSFEIQSFLTGLNYIVFTVFGLLFLFKYLFRKIFYKYIKDNIDNPIYIIVICVILTIVTSKIVFEFPLKWKYLIIIFTYLFGIITICLRVFFNK